MKIVKICTPLGPNHLEPQTHQCLNVLYNALLKHPDYDFDLERDVHQKRNAYISFGRGECVGVMPYDALDVLPWGGDPYDAILWIDSDMDFEPWMALRLLESDHPIVGGGYINDARDGLCAWGMNPATGFVEPITGLVWDEQKDEYLHLAHGGLGFGFLCMQHGVLERVPRPWFDHQVIDVRWGRGEQMGGEDVSFFRRVDQAGIPVMMDTVVTYNLKHIKKISLTVRDLVATKKPMNHGVCTVQESAAFTGQFRDLVFVGSRYHINVVREAARSADSQMDIFHAETMGEALEYLRDPNHPRSLVLCSDLTPLVDEVDFGDNTLVGFVKSSPSHYSHIQQISILPIDERYRERPFHAKLDFSMNPEDLMLHVWNTYQIPKIMNSITIMW